MALASACGTLPTPSCALIQISMSFALDFKSSASFVAAVPFLWYPCAFVAVGGICAAVEDIFNCCGPVMLAASWALYCSPAAAYPRVTKPTLEYCQHVPTLQGEQ